MEDCTTLLQCDHGLKPHGKLRPSSSSHRTHARSRSKNGSRHCPPQSIVYDDVFGGHAKYSLPSHTTVFAGTIQQRVFPSSLQNYDDIFRIPASNSSVTTSNVPAIDAHLVDCDILGRLTRARKNDINVAYDDVFSGVSGISTGPEVLADLLLEAFIGQQSSSKSEQKEPLSGQNGTTLSHQNASDECLFSSTVEPLDRDNEYLQENHGRGKSNTPDMDGIWLRGNHVKKEHTWSNPLFQDTFDKFEDTVKLAEAYQSPERPPPFPDSTSPYTFAGTKVPLQEAVDAHETSEIYVSESEENVKNVSRNQIEKRQDLPMSMVEKGLDENISLSAKEKTNKINEALETANEIMRRETVEVSFRHKTRWAPMDRKIEEENDLSNNLKIHIMHDVRCMEKANIQIHGKEKAGRLLNESETQNTVLGKAMEREYDNRNEIIEKSTLADRKLDMLELDGDWIKGERSETVNRMSGVQDAEQEDDLLDNFVEQETRAEERKGEDSGHRQEGKVLQRETDAEEKQLDAVKHLKDVANGIMKRSSVLELSGKEEGKWKTDEIERGNDDVWRKEKRNRTEIRMPQVQNIEGHIGEQRDNSLDDFLEQEVSRAEKRNAKQGEDRQEVKALQRVKEAEKNHINAAEHQKDAINGIMECAPMLEARNKEEDDWKLKEIAKEKDYNWRKEEKRETKISMPRVQNTEIHIREREGLLNDFFEERNGKQGEDRQELKLLQREKEVEENQTDAIEHLKQTINDIIEGGHMLESRDKEEGRWKSNDREKEKDDDRGKEERIEIRMSGVRNTESRNREEEYDPLDDFADQRNGKQGGDRQERKGLQRENLTKENQMDAVDHQKHAVNGIMEKAPILQFKDKEEGTFKPRRQDRAGMEKLQAVQEKHQKEEGKGTNQGITTDGITEKVMSQMMLKKEGSQKENKKTTFSMSQVKHTEVEAIVKESGILHVDKDVRCQRKTKEQGIDVKEKEKMKKENEARERHRKEKEERERQREREKDRITVEGFTQENRGRPAGEKVATEKLAQKKGAAVAEEKVLEEARERALGETYSERTIQAQGKEMREARAWALRAALEEREKSGERSAIDAGETFTEKPDKQQQLIKGASFGSQQSTSHKAVQMRSCSSSVFVRSDSFEFQEIEEKPTERERARWERHQIIIERTVRALEEKKQRDLQSQREQAERQRVAGALDGEINRWAAGKEGNIRALLSTLQNILWQESGWQPVSLADLFAAASVKKAYRKAALCVHPDKVQQKGATIHQKYIAEKVFDLLKEAWNRFSSDELA